MSSTASRSFDPPPVWERAIILGAGPAGLACADELSRHDIKALVIDRSERVGGLLRAVDLDGYRLDIGGHRFLSKSAEVNSLWKETMGNDLIRVRRRSRILYRSRYFEYPLKLHNAMAGLGVCESLRCVWSYLVSKIFPGDRDAHFEAWITQKFGRRLYEIFFKTYTEKVWGVSCAALSASWADQRIQGLSLGKAILQSMNILRGNRFKTLSESFLYPKLGPGMFAEKLKDIGQARGNTYRLGAEVEEIEHKNGRVVEVLFRDKTGLRQAVRGDVFFSSLPLTALIEKLRPIPPPEILEKARLLKFRGFISVFLVLNTPRLFDDQWLYIHDPEVKAGRIQNYKNWSPVMVPDPQTTSLGIEYFVNEGDSIWNLSDADMTVLAEAELQKLGFDIRGKRMKSLVLRVPHAYPLYSPGYRDLVADLRVFLSRFVNLQTLGRAGLFRYNNSDHALLTGIYAARNILGESHDLWSVDPDAS